MRRWALLLLVLWCPPLGGSQHDGHQPAPPHAAATEQPRPPDRVQGVEPIRCWRQASAGAVAIGESFTVVLTCAVYESPDTQVVPDESRLNVASIQVAPFEILGGAHPADLRHGLRRFFQYDYQLRLISPDAIGHDVNVPPLTISYRIHSRVGAAASIEGRDLSYLLPPLPIKVLSLVPADADDIRDAGDANLATVESLRLRSRLFGWLGWALAAVAAVLAFVPLTRRAGTQGDAGRARVPERTVAKRVAEELREVQARARSAGWSDDLVSRAAHGLRLVAAVALNHRVSQQPLVAGDHPPEGRVAVTHGWLRRTTLSVSSSVTPDHVAVVVGSGVSMTATRLQQLDELKMGLAAMTAALYDQSPSRDAAALDEAVGQAAALAADLAAERGWWKSRWVRR